MTVVDTDSIASVCGCVQITLLRDNNMRIVFTGGGSGGHVMPNLALINEIGDRADIHYIGSNGIEHTLLAQYKNVTYHCYNPPKLKRQLALSNLTIPIRLIQSIKQASAILRKISPDVVFSKGGYVGLPVVYSASRLNLPCVGHEADRTLGLAHRLVVGRYERLFTTFDTPRPYKNMCRVGAILRQSIYHGNPQEGLKICGFDGSRPILLLLGGSLGATSLNDFYMNNTQALTDSYDCILVTGKGKDSASKPHFKVMSYCNSIEHLYACTSVCVTRGGANTLCELTALSIPFVAIPLANASRNEQTANAEYFLSIQAGTILAQKNLTISNLLSSISSAQDNHFVNADVARSIDGTRIVVDYLLSKKR
ncbi:MAG: glycosyltransferase [Clostridia bacterium]|nr:glycosyltransferase [Clostridia bacterium]